MKMATKKTDWWSGVVTAQFLYQKKLHEYAQERAEKEGTTLFAIGMKDFIKYYKKLKRGQYK